MKAKITSLALVCLAFVFMLALPGLAGKWRDNFDDGKMDEWDLSYAGGIWEVKNGELVITPRGAGAPVQLFIGDSTWQDYTINVKAKIVEHQPSSYGFEGANIVARAEPPLNLYVFGLGASVGSKDKEVYAVCVQGRVAPTSHHEVKPFQWELDTWYDLRLTAEGNRFKFYVNDELVIDYIDDVHSRGKAGIAASAFRSTTAVHFDDFSVTGDDIPDNVTAISPKSKLATTWSRIKQ
jgi:hypothetical protein